MARRKRTDNTRNPSGVGSFYYSEKDGYYHARVTVGIRDDGTPDRRHVMRKNEADAHEAYRKLLDMRDKGTVRKPGRPWKVKDWLTHWVENIAAPTVRRNTLVGYRAAVYGYLIPGIGAHRLDRLQPEHLESLYRKLATTTGKHGKTLRPATIHQAHRTVRTALGEAVRRGHLTGNPAQVARPPRVPDEEITPFTKEEAQQILKACHSRRNGARFILALTLGLRKGEALGLQWRDIDYEGRTITVRRSLQPVKWQHGCSENDPCGRRHAGHCPQRHGGGVIAQEVKSRAGRRTVGVPAQVVATLREHEHNQQLERAQAGDLWHDEDWVFTNRLGRPVHPRSDHKEWKDLLNDAGVRDARLHDARHTAATMLLVLGVPSRAVMDVMGWSHIGMTTRYQHITSELSTSIADKMGGLFWPGEDGDADHGSAD
ncbi:Site-specific recombinase XerD [Haloechinothrix alba]|uniref:Site-specific recombinase XerD n=1 Tax=Haloechinothrix alba TaxID=664784 RepID=A0A238V6I6_9PSEU|nr:site-specific integrase [Haloechinothrix alba]SNR29119.1 Site-specific recombinase XerD [Haloechinothrix alba]